MEAKTGVLEAALSKGELELRSGLVQQFSAWLKSHPEEENKYNAAAAVPGSKHAAKKAFRLRWAQTQLELVTQTKSQLESYQKIDEDIGTYEPFEMVVKYEGGRKSKAVYKAALNYAKKCVGLGVQWLLYNEFTKRVDILYVKKSKRSAFARHWNLYEEHIAKSQENTEGLARQPETQERQLQLQHQDDPLETPKKDVVAMPKAGGRNKRPESPGAPTDDPKKAKTSSADKENQKVVKQCQILKQVYHKVSSVYNSRMRSMTAKADPSWADLANPTMISKLENMMSEIDAIVQQPFADEFITRDWNDMRKAYAKEMGNLYFKLRALLTDLQPKVEAMDLELTRLNRRFLA